MSAKEIETELRYNSMKRKDWVDDDMLLVSLKDAITIVREKLKAAPEPSSASSDAAASEGTTRKMSYGTEMTLARNRRNNKAVKIAHDDLIRAKKEFNAAASEGS